MRRRPEGRARKQAKSEWFAGQAERAAREVLRQLMLPLVAGVLATKEALFGLVQQSGLAVMQEVFAEDAAKVAGAKGRHQLGRRAQGDRGAAASSQRGGARDSSAED